MLESTSPSPDGPAPSEGEPPPRQVARWVLEQRRSALEEAAGRVSDPSCRAALVAIAQGLGPVDRPPAEAARARERLAAMLDGPDQPTVVLRQLACIQAIRLALEDGSPETAKQRLGLLQSLARPQTPDDPPELEVLRLDAEATLQGLEGRIQEALHLLDRAICVCPLEPGSAAWKQLVVRHARAALDCYQFVLAEEDADALAQRADDAVIAGYLKARTAMALDRIDDGLRLLADLREKHPVDRHPSFQILHLRLLLFGNDFERADERLRAYRPDLPEGAESAIKALAALLQSKLDAARKRLHGLLGDASARAPAASGDSLTPDIGPREAPLRPRNLPAISVKWAQRLLADTELAAGQAAPARKLLEGVDPAGRNPKHHMRWARLHLLEGASEQARAAIRSLHRLAGSAGVRRELRFAYELSAPQLAFFWEAVEGAQPVSHPAPHSPAPQEANAGDPVHRAASEADLVGRSRTVIAIRRRVPGLAAVGDPVLLVGEEGTGKKRVARLLHDQGPRAAEPFAALDCSDLSETLLESELFGHVRGAFSGADAHRAGLLKEVGGGTVLLENGHALPPHLQAAMLRILEDSEIQPAGTSAFHRVACRLILATPEPLETLARRGVFRQDLYFALSRRRVEIPPLRERREDILPLARHFLERLREGEQMAVGQQLLEALHDHPWPGNVGELRRVMERMGALAENPRVLGRSLFDRALQELASDRDAPAASGGDPAQAELLPPEPPRNTARTVSRRRYLRQLFRYYDRLTQKEIVEILGCAPKTAQRDLVALQEEGVIRRVDTSRHRRTSYFVLASGPGGADT